MEIKPVHTSIGRLFHEQYVFSVPKYQRNYAWTECEIEDFLNDINKCYVARKNSETRHHFFGGVVSIEKDINGTSRRHCELVDGQQRVATFYIFVYCIIQLYNNLSEVASSKGDTTNKELSIRRSTRLNEKYLKYEDEINRKAVIIDRLELSQSDKQFLKDIMGNLKPTPTRQSHKRLLNVFKTINDRLLQTLNEVESIEEKIDLLEIYEKILDDDVTIIHMITKTRTEAYRLFQVLNDRGTSLTEGDLLRARTLELLDSSQFSSQQEAAEKAWDSILQDPPSMTSNFLKWYYASVNGKRHNNSSLFDEFLDAFFPQHKNADISLEDAKKIATQIQLLKNDIEKLRLLVDGEWPYLDIDPSITQWHKERLRLLIKELDHTQCMPLLLSATRLDQKKFFDLISIVERFFFRYKLICGAHIGSPSKVYLDHAVLIRTNPTIYKVSSLKDSLRVLEQNKAQDSFFKSSIPELLHYRTSGGNKILKYFLITVEYYYRWYIDGAQGSPKCRDLSVIYDFANTNIEHVYCQNSVERDDEIEGLINTLGNLTFLCFSDNEALGNKSFEQKKAILGGSSVRMNREIAQYENWNKESINDRQTKLIDIALKIFAL